MIPVERVCRFWISKDGFCRAKRELTECFGNIWYCDFPTDRKLVEQAEDELEEENGK